MLDGAIRQTFSKLLEDLKKKSTSDQKDYEKKTIHRQTFSLKHPSTAILVEESSTVNPKVLSPETHNQKSNNYLAIKLNRLKGQTSKIRISQRILIALYNRWSCTKRT